MTTRFDTDRIREGFPGQRSVVLPRSVVRLWLESEPFFDFLPCDVGYYPGARNHFVERNKGIDQSVLIFCADGNGWLRLGTETVSLRAGDAALIAPHVVHSYGASSPDPWTIYWIHIDGKKASLAGQVLGLGKERVVLHPGLDPALPSLFEKLLAVLGDGYTSDNLFSASVVLGQIIAFLAARRHRQRNRSTHHLENRIQRVIEIMHDNLARKFSVEDFAREANMSASHLAAMFRRHTGFAIIDFFLRLKIQRACFLLDNTDLEIKVIAGEVGFDDPLYFSRCFRRVHSCSPSEYRAMRKG